MPNINITIRNKEAVAPDDALIVCGNSDYTLTFDFDSEWDSLPVKTARFSYTRNGEPKYIDQPFSLDSVEVPVLSGISIVEVGVFAGDLHTTTGARIPCKRSIQCGGGVHEEPPRDIYNEVQQACNEAIDELGAVGRELTARFNEAVAMRSEEGLYREEFTHNALDTITGVIISNGISAHIGLRISSESDLGTATELSIEGMISPQFAPFTSVTLTGTAGEANVVLFAPDASHEWPYVKIYPAAANNYGTYTAFYPLAKPFISELADMRVGNHGTYDTAGDALRAETAGVEQVIEQTTEQLTEFVQDARLLADSAHELATDAQGDLSILYDEVKALKKGGPLDVHEVEDYAFAVSDEEGNIAFGIKEDGETVGTFADKVARDKLAPITSTKDYAYAVCDDYGNVVFGITPDGEVKYFGAGEGGESGGGEAVVPTFDYTKCGLPVLALTGDTSDMTKDDAVELNYTIETAKGTTIASGICECKWQGSSSVRRGYPKRNYTIKFYKAEKVDGELVKNPFDATRLWPYDSERVTNFPNKDGAEVWGQQYKYCLKANWIDPSAARNVVLAKLWGAIVASRENVPEKLAAAPNKGAIDGFPVIIAINGEFTGLYTFNIPKDGWMFNMGDGADEYIVAGESNSMSACGFYDEATFIEGVNQASTDFAIEYQPDDVADETVIGSFKAAVNAVMNAPNSADWEDAVAPYFDIDSAIDYYIFVCCIGGMDNLRKNILYGTYDGVKWFMSAYDLDTTLGSNPYGTGLYPVKTSKTQFYEAANGSGKHRLFELIYKYSRDKLKERWEELRGGILSDANVWYMLNNFVNAIPRAVYNADAEKWPTMPATTTANVEAYMQYYRMHCALLDKEMEE